jgi:hypothetical protein
MLLIVVVAVIVVAVLWWVQSERAISRNEKQYLKRRGYDAGEPLAEGPPVHKDTRLYGLIESLGDLSPFARQRAAEELSRMCENGGGDTRMLPALLAALNDSDPSVRGAVAVALGNLGDRKAIEALKARLEEDESIHVKAALDKAMRKLLSQTPIEQQS